MDLALATAYVEFKGRGNLTEIINRHKAALGNLQTAYSSGALGKYQIEQANIAKQMERINQAARFDFLQQTEGKLSAYLTVAGEKLAKFHEKFSGMFRGAGFAGAVASGAIAGAGSLANPYEAQRFMWAVKDLTAVIGQMLTPYLRMFSDFIRGVADFLAGLPEPIKRVIGGFTAVVAVGGTLTWAFGKMIGFASGTSAALARLAVAANAAAVAQTRAAASSGAQAAGGMAAGAGVTAGVASGPVGWVALAVAAVALIGYGIYKFFTDGKDKGNSWGAAPRGVSMGSDAAQGFRDVQMQAFRIGRPEANRQLLIAQETLETLRLIEMNQRRREAGLPQVRLVNREQVRRN